jgi:hypothetical protein
MFVLKPKLHELLQSTLIEGLVYIKYKKNPEKLLFLNELSVMSILNLLSSYNLSTLLIIVD